MQWIAMSSLLLFWGIKQAKSDLVTIYTNSLEQTPLPYVYVDMHHSMNNIWLHWMQLTEADIMVQENNGEGNFTELYRNYKWQCI
jgi:hypothetical protein